VLTMLDYISENLNSHKNEIKSIRRTLRRQSTFNRLLAVSVILLLVHGINAVKHKLELRERLDAELEKIHRRMEV
jgi:hypothetical protein